LGDALPCTAAKTVAFIIFIYLYEKIKGLSRALIRSCVMAAPDSTLGPRGSSDQPPRRILVGYQDMAEPRANGRPDNGDFLKSPGSQDQLPNAQQIVKGGVDDARRQRVSDRPAIGVEVVSADVPDSAGIAPTVTRMAGVANRRLTDHVCRRIEALTPMGEYQRE
jgi:hypothetical protein